MSTMMIRMGLRQTLAGKNLLVEKKLLPFVCNGFQENDAAITGNAIATVSSKHYAVRQISSGIREVHHAQAAALIDEDHDDHDSDTDSGNESPKKHESARGRSNFWRRKMRTLHGHLDVNKDGVLSYDDFKLLGERFAKLGHLTSQQKDEFQNVLRQIWVEQWGAPEEYNQVDVERYLTEMNHVLEDKSLRKKVHHFLPYLFIAVNKHNDGKITVEEFKMFYKCLGIERDHAVRAFASIDVNEDGIIRMKEFVKLGRDYFLTDDQSRPSRHFWGPLVE